MRAPHQIGWFLFCGLALIGCPDEDDETPAAEKPPRTGTSIWARRGAYWIFLSSQGLQQKCPWLTCPQP